MDNTTPHQRQPQRRAIISIGSNIAGDLENPAAQLRRAVSLLDNPPKVRVVETSRVFITPPWGGVEQEDFHNQTVAVETELEPVALLEFCQQIEQAAQRMRDVRWGPRTLDVDIIAYAQPTTDGVGDGAEFTKVELHLSTLEIPHPRAHLRAFVLVPWLDLPSVAEPWWTIGGSSVSELVAQLPDAERREIRPVEAATESRNPGRAGWAAEEGES